MGDISASFNRSEFKCRCRLCEFDTIDAELINVLQDVRDYFGSPVNINSASRCKHHNAKEGGAKTSQHIYGRAADITVTGVPAAYVQRYLLGKYPDQYGIGRYSNFTHIDTRNYKARW